MKETSNSAPPPTHITEWRLIIMAKTCRNRNPWLRCTQIHLIHSSQDAPYNAPWGGGGGPKATIWPGLVVQKVIFPPEKSLDFQPWLANVLILIFWDLASYTESWHQKCKTGAQQVCKISQKSQGFLFKGSHSGLDQMTQGLVAVAPEP